MLKIGITGGIGSGKTTVCKIFELLGVPVYYADDEAKKLLDSDLAVKEAILNEFGAEVLNDHSQIDRKKLASLVFNNPANLALLNSIVHPAVGTHFETWLNNNNGSGYILKEAAILFESGAYKGFDKVITVVAPLELKIDRVVKRDKTTREQVEQRINNQLSDDEKIERSQFVVFNDEQQLLIPQVLKIHALLQ